MGSQTNGAEMPWDSGVPERGERLATRRKMRWTLWLESICLVGLAAAIVWIISDV